MLILTCGQEAEWPIRWGISRTEILPSSPAALEVRSDGTKEPRHYTEIQNFIISLLQLRTQRANHSAKVY